jgi:hypothetical protein
MLLLDTASLGNVASQAANCRSGTGASPRVPVAPRTGSGFDRTPDTTHLSERGPSPLTTSTMTAPDRASTRVVLTYKGGGPLKPAPLLTNSSPAGCLKTCRIAVLHPLLSLRW